MINIQNFIKKIVPLGLTANAIYKSAQITFFVAGLACKLNSNLNLDVEKNQILEVSSGAALLSLFMDLWQNNRFDEIQVFQNILPNIGNLIENFIPSQESINETQNYILDNLKEITNFINPA